jgi:hypothetical protein
MSINKTTIKRMVPKLMVFSLFLDLIADDTAYGSTTHGSTSAAASEDSACSGAHTRTHSGVTVTRGHVAAGPQANQGQRSGGRQGKAAEGRSNLFHGNSFFSGYTLLLANKVPTVMVP